MSLEVSASATFSATGATPFDIDVDLTVEAGETLVVLGPSGSGKTLLLETVAGYHGHDGSVRVDGRDVTNEPPEARGFGFVFQNYALFPHLTVRENVEFGTRYHEDTRDPDELLAELHIAALADRTPATLSGGEAQRVALARSLAVRPSTVLLDEPLSALDVPTRETLRDELAGVLDGVTALYVTHNRTTARALGDRIAVMRAGRVVQVGPPEAVFQRPATPFVARFTGSNCVPASVWSAAAIGDATQRVGDGPADAVSGDRPPGRPSPSAGEPAWLGVRPEHVELGEGGAVAVVERVERRDVGYRVSLSREGSTLEAYTADPPATGTETTVRFPAERAVRFTGDGEPES